jgi:aminopeptidase N
MLRSQLLNDPDVIGRILAAQALIKTSTRANIDAVIDAFEQESFWGVRCEYAKALADANHQAAINGLAHLIQIEHEPRVVLALLRAAAAYRDAALQTTVEQRLQAGLRPLAHQAAYVALGAQRQRAPMALLAAAADQPTPDGYIQAGAFQALGETRQLAALPILQAKAAYGSSPNRTRPAAVAALAALGKGQERATRQAISEQLIDLLRDPWPPATWAAATGLTTLDATGAIDALDAFGRALSAQERATVDRLLDGLRQEDKLDGSAVKKEVEELRDKLRKLEDQLQTLSARFDAGAPSSES